MRNLLARFLFVTACFAPPARAASLPESCLAAGGYLDESAFEARLSDPIASNDAATADLQRSFEKILTCLWKVTAPGSAAPVAPEIWYLLAFAGSAEHSRLPRGDPRADSLYQAWSSPRESVELKTSDDPALIRIRTELSGLAPPEGLAFIRYFRDRDSAPQPIRDLFEKDAVGVTLDSRYIAILGTPAESGHVRSHELAHSYLLSAIPANNRDKLPGWFHEVLAIHFSGAVGTEVTAGGEGNDFTVRRDTPEYREYAQISNYLSTRFGMRELRGIFVETLLSGDIDRLLRKCGVGSYGGLVEISQRRESRNSVAFLLFATLIFAACCRHLIRWLNYENVTAPALLHRYYGGFQGAFSEEDYAAAERLIASFGRRRALRRVPRCARSREPALPFHQYVTELMERRRRLRAKLRAMLRAI